MRLRKRPPTRRCAFDVAAAGPLAGFAALLPVLWAGVALSAPAPLDAAPDTARAIGHPALLQATVALIHGPLDDGHALALHPVATAAWIGMLLTALNLFPAGQLDGGHVAHALLPRGWARTAGLAATTAAALLSTESTIWIAWTLVTSTMTFTNWNATPWNEPPAAVGNQAPDRRRRAGDDARALLHARPARPAPLTRPRRQTPQTPEPAGDAPIPFTRTRT